MECFLVVVFPTPYSAGPSPSGPLLHTFLQQRLTMPALSGQQTELHVSLLSPHVGEKDMQPRPEGQEPNISHSKLDTVI